MFKKLSTIALCLLAVGLSGHAYAEGDATNAPPEVTEMVASSSGAMAGSHRTLAPFLQVKADFEGAETQMLPVFRDIRFRNGKGGYTYTTSVLLGYYKYVVNFPSLYNVSSSGAKTLLGSWNSAGAFVNRYTNRTGGLWQNISPTVNGVAMQVKSGTVAWSPSKYQVTSYSRVQVNPIGPPTSTAVARVYWVK